MAIYAHSTVYRRWHQLWEFLSGKHNDHFTGTITLNFVDGGISSISMVEKIPSFVLDRSEEFGIEFGKDSIKSPNGHY
jgi:hypothetical protein